MHHHLRGATAQIAVTYHMLETRYLIMLAKSMTILGAAQQAVMHDFAAHAGVQVAFMQQFPQCRAINCTATVCLPTFKKSTNPINNQRMSARIRQGWRCCSTQQPTGYPWV